MLKPADNDKLRRILSFWGKAGERRDDGVSPWHPLAYHCLDVAACVQRILVVRPRARERASKLLNTDTDQAIAFLTTLAALHDVGKFASCFQAKRPDLWPVVLDEVPVGMRTTYHTDDGLCIWLKALKASVGDAIWKRKQKITPIIQAIMGHHGRPLAADFSCAYEVTFAPAARRAATDFASIVLALTEPVALSSPISEREVRKATWWIAGLMTTADWIGSNESAWFPYREPDPADDALRAYWRESQRKAEHAVREAGLESPRASASRSFVELTGKVEPTPVQQWASNVALPDGPALFIIEDVTGAGKTEAAQILVHRLMQARRATGAFWAMPTQATANAMYERQAKAVRALFDDEDRNPSLVLAHGQSRLHERFRETVLLPASAERDENPFDDHDVPGEIECAAFLANSTRSSLMADVGAGTVDQAMLAVLPSKFNTMRLFGLSEKVLVLDEVHAYDAYMVEEIRALLRFHAELGGSVIVLSATLSKGLWAALVDEWRASNSTADVLSTVDQADAYPLATVVEAAGRTLEQRAQKPADWSRRSVGVRCIDSESRAVDELVAAANAGAAVVWIRNTVDSCCAAAEILRARGVPNVDVFHARFAQQDRQRREAYVLAKFGADASDEERAGRVLVATQVVEQSLDLDFDVMVSDLAPVDLLIQRAGRLHRHRRQGRPPSGGPELIVLTPAFEENPDPAWLDSVLPGTRFVYGDVSVLWRTRRIFTQSTSIVTPGGLRELIRSVYDSEDCPPNLESATAKAAGNAAAATSMARLYALAVQDGYTGDGAKWVTDVRVPTRFDDNQITVRMGRVLNDGSIVPFAEDAEGRLPPWHLWSLSEVRVSQRRVPRGSVPGADLVAACDEARAQWGRWEREIPLLPLQPLGDKWKGALVRPDGNIVIVAYSRPTGLLFDAK